MAEHWEVARLVAALEPGIVERLRLRHPADGWCWSCARSAPCPSRTLAEAADQE